MELPNWALIIMWASGLVGMFMLTRQMVKVYL